MRKCLGLRTGPTQSEAVTTAHLSRGPLAGLVNRFFGLLLCLHTLSRSLCPGAVWPTSLAMHSRVGGSPIKQGLQYGSVQAEDHLLPAKDYPRLLGQQPLRPLGQGRVHICAFLKCLQYSVVVQD